jgi:hypothetical protein
MAWSGQHFEASFIAGEALDTVGHEGIAIQLTDRKVANSGANASGILMSHSKPKVNEHGSIGVGGILKFRAGGAIGAGARVTVTTSGYFTVVVSGGEIVGRAFEAVTSGSIGTGIFSFIGSPKVTSWGL